MICTPNMKKYLKPFAFIAFIVTLLLCESAFAIGGVATSLLSLKTTLNPHIFVGKYSYLIENNSQTIKTDVKQDFAKSFSTFNTITTGLTFRIPHTFFNMSLSTNRLHSTPFLTTADIMKNGYVYAKNVPLKTQVISDTIGLSMPILPKTSIAILLSHAIAENTIYFANGAIQSNRYNGFLRAISIQTFVPMKNNVAIQVGVIDKSNALRTGVSYFVGLNYFIL